VLSDLTPILERTRFVLLDFDGPVCSIFAGIPAPRVAAQLQGLLFDGGWELPVTVMREEDPIAVLRYTAALGPEVSGYVDAALRAAEVMAAHTARPTPDTAEVIHACNQTGRGLAVVSNNSSEAVSTYLRRHGLIEYVTPVVGRTSPDPRLLKPDPHLVRTAVDLLRADPEECTLIGDSVADITSARAAGIRSIGYAHVAGQHDQLTRAGATAVTGSMKAVAAALRAHRPLGP
jgi:phosphoglycolate phosphatase